MRKTAVAVALIPTTGLLAVLAAGCRQGDLRARAERGDAKAQVELGTVYESGRGVLQDYAQAVLWYRKAAEQGFAMGQVSLGGMYAEGRGVPQDDAQAASWYRKAAEQGNPLGQFHLGVMHFLGRGIPKDNIEAYKWLNLAAARSSGDYRQFAKTSAETRDRTAELMTPAELSEAVKRAREWTQAFERRQKK